MSTPSNDKNSSTGIRVIPPLVYMAGLLIGLIMEYLWPTIDLTLGWRLGISAPVLLASVVLIILTLKYFKSASTPFDVRKTASSLIIDGPFRFSRNPGYVALTMLYLTLGVFLSSLWALLMALPILFVVDKFVVRKEEISLLSSFGDPYRDYQSKVRRWL